MPKKCGSLTMTCIALAAIAPADIALAQHRSTETLSTIEQKLMTRAAQSNIAEIEEGRLAMTQSTNPLVQALGNRLVQDHSQAQATLEAFAATMGAKLPANPDESEEQEIGKLTGLKGTAFDKVFAPAEITLLEKLTAQAQRAMQHIHNAALKAWLESNLPVLQEHLELARHLSDSSASPATVKFSSAGIREWGPPKSNVADGTPR